MKKHLITFSLLAGVIVLLGGFYIPIAYLQSLAINIGTTFLAVALGIIVVNIYLERDARRNVITALLQLSSDGISNFHNTFINIVYTKFGKDDFGELREKYTKSEGNILVLTPDQRRYIYSIANENQSTLNPLLEKLDQSLSETISLVGWTLDSEFLSQAIQARNAIRKFRVIELNDSDLAVNQTAEQLLDIDIFSSTAYHLLKQHQA